MAKQIQISINGKAYPCRQTMGAMLRFKRETGREVTESSEGSLSDIVTLLWCCIVSACNADKVDVDTAVAWAATIQGESDEDSDEKKSR